jgi:hypothetical protein
MKQGLIIDEKGYKAWYLNGELHREYGPACEYSNGTKEWFINGQRHRVDGHAIEYSDGSKSWYLNNKLVYSKYQNNIHLFPNLSKQFKNSIIKHRLTL